MASKKYSYMKRADRGPMAWPSACYLGPNARKLIDREKLDRLKAQITGVGVHEPLLVRRLQGEEEGQHLQVWDGQRRLLAVNELIAEGEGIQWIPVKIEKLSDAEMMLMAAKTVTGKEPLDSIDEAGLVTMLLGYGLEVEEIATRLGMSVPWVNRRRQLQRLEPKARRVLRSGLITIGRAEELSKLSGAKQIAKLPKPSKPGSKAKPQGKQAKRPGKKQIRLLATRLAPQVHNAGGLAVDEVEAILLWVAGDLTQEELQQRLPAVDFNAAPPAKPPVTLTDEELIKAEMEARQKCVQSGGEPGPYTEEFLQAQMRQQLAVLEAETPDNPMVEKVQQALGVTVPPARPDRPGGEA